MRFASKNCGYGCCCCHCCGYCFADADEHDDCDYCGCDANVSERADGACGDAGQATVPARGDARALHCRSGEAAAAADHNTEEILSRETVRHC